MARHVVFSLRAKAWFDAELIYLGERSAAAARRMVERIATARRPLADFPQRGARGVVPGTRRLVVAPCVLTYREATSDLVVILAIRHGRQREMLPPSDP